VTCAYGGNRIQRHDMVVRAVRGLARTALGAGPTKVELEPWLIKQGALGPDGRVCVYREGLRADLLLTGLDTHKPRSYLDVRIPYPDASLWRKCWKRTRLRRSRGTRPHARTTSTGPASLCLSPPQRMHGVLGRGRKRC